MFSLLGLPDGINNSKAGGMSTGKTLIIHRGYRLIERKDLTKNVSYTGGYMKISEDLESGKINLAEREKQVNDLIDKVLSKAFKILNDIDKKINKQKEKDNNSGKCYLNSNSGAIIGIKIIYDEDRSAKRFFVSFRNKEQKKLTETIDINDLGFDNAFELAVKKLCEFMEINLDDVKDLFMDAKKNYQPKKPAFS